MRQVANMRKCINEKTVDNKKGCINPPLLNIEPRDCVVDELHLLLRITDVLFDNLFVELCRLDYVSTVHKNGTDDHVERASRFVCRMGISFKVTFTDGMENRRKSKNGVSLSPLNRNDRLKILIGLPSAFDDLLPNSLAVHLAKLWVVS